MTPTADRVAIRPYRPADRAALLALLRHVWAHKPDIERQVSERWWWQSTEPPLVVAEDTSARALVGLCAYMPFTLRAGGRDTSCAWFVDFYVLPQRQGQGLGQRLTQAVLAQFAITASLSQTAMAYRVFQKLGWHERTAVALSMNPLPGRWMRSKPGDGLRCSAQPVTAGLPEAGDLDALWARASGSREPLAVRDRAHVLTRYARLGGREYVAVLSHRGQECAGYMIVRCVPPRSGRGAAHGLIVDYLTHAGDAAAFRALLSEATSVLTDLGAKRIYCLSTSADDRRILGARGFLSPDTPLIGRRLQSQRKWLTFHAAPNAPAIDPARWFLTLGDCDLEYAW